MSVLRVRPAIAKLVLFVMATALVACSSQQSTVSPSATSATSADSGAGRKTVINGAGATFPAPLYERYAVEFKKKHPDIQVNYQAIGSGGGVKQTIAETVDFGGSDAAMTDEEMAQVKRGVLLIPTAGGAVSVIYNLKGVSSLKLSRDVLPEIFSNKIQTWNDPKIAKANPGVTLPNQRIRPVVRADGSGTTFIFTSHLSAINASFKADIGANKAPKWQPGAIKSRGNAGVAASVRQTPGSIGYAEFSYAKENNIPTAQLENSQGEYVLPSVESANKALENVKFPSDYRVFVDDPKQGYPIVGLTWMMVYKTYPAGKAEAVKKWIDWVLGDGQVINPTLSYTQIPSQVAQSVKNTVNTTLK
jgi:phosphate transport system substrate-binding protein